MKRVVALFMALTMMAVTLTACGSSSKSESVPKGTETTQESKGGDEKEETSDKSDKKVKTSYFITMRC